MKKTTQQALGVFYFMVLNIALYAQAGHNTDDKKFQTQTEVTLHRLGSYPLKK